MPRKRPRASSFLFEPGRFRHDHAVMAMSPAGRGAYVMLFCAGWEMIEAGVFPDDDLSLASMAMVSPEIWGSVRGEVSRAFDLESRPGFWVQKGLIETKHAQDRFVSAQKRRGKAGAKARWHKGKDGTSIATEPMQAPWPTSVLGSRFSGTEESKNQTLAHEDVSVHAAVANGSDAESDPSPEEWFLTTFWPKYPRRVGRGEALRAFSSIARKTPKARHDDLATEMLAGLERDQREEWAQSPMDKIPHGRTWIANRRWER